jgi:hypothetical protein
MYNAKPNKAKQSKEEEGKSLNQPSSHCVIHHITAFIEHKNKTKAQIAHHLIILD